MYSGWPLLVRENENSLLLFNPHQSGVKGGTAFPCSLPLIIAFFKQVRINFCHPKHHRVLLQHRSLLIQHQLLPVSLHWAETGWIVWISVLEAFIPGVLTPIKPFQEEMRTGAALGGNKSSHPGLAGRHGSRWERGHRVPPARAPEPAWAVPPAPLQPTALTAGLTREQGHELLFLCLIPALHVHRTQITVILPLICNKYPKYEN